MIVPADIINTIVSDLVIYLVASLEILYYIKTYEYRFCDILQFTANDSEQEEATFFTHIAQLIEVRT